MSVKGRRQAGFSLLEIVIAMAVMAVALLGLASFITSSGRVEEENGYRTLAYNAARQVVEDMRSATFNEVYARYNKFTADNPASGVSPGHTFSVSGLPRFTGGAPQGEILFPESSTTGPGLAENPADAVLRAELGMPKDLNRDGDASDTALTSYAILPVKVRVRWMVPGGQTSEVKVVTYVAER